MVVGFWGREGIHGRSLVFIGYRVALETVPILDCAPVILILEGWTVSSFLSPLLFPVGNRHCDAVLCPPCQVPEDFQDLCPAF